MINFILEYWFIAALVVAGWAFNEARKPKLHSKRQVDALTEQNMRHIDEKTRRIEVDKLLLTLEKQRNQ